MNRNHEYRALLEELEALPAELETTVDKAVKRDLASRKKRRAFRASAVSFAACFAAFVLLVNAFPTFARACESIPLLSALTEAVRFSPSLSAAVENEYVQTIGHSQTKNGVTATVEHVIVDRKQVSVFFTLDGDFTEYLDFRYEVSVPDMEQGWASSTGSYGKKNGELRQVDVNFVDMDVPDTLCLNLKIYDSADDWDPDAPPAEESVFEDYGDEMLFSEGEPEREYVAEFDFTLEFDPTYTATGEILPVNQTFLLDGQTITVTEAEVYPTHLRLNFCYHEDNTAWLGGLQFYLENEHGERFESVVNGISGVGSADSPAMSSFWVDSPFFNQGEQLTLHITGAEWLDKEQERVKIDLVNETGENLPEGVRIEWAEKRDGGWILSTSAPYRWGDECIYQVWKHSFYDAEGNGYDITSRSSTNTPMFLGTLSGGELEAHRAYEEANRDRYFETFPLKGYTADEVWLEPSWTTITTQETPVVISIK